MVDRAVAISFVETARSALEWSHSRSRPRQTASGQGVRYMATRHIIASLKSHVAGDCALSDQSPWRLRPTRRCKGHSKTAEMIRGSADEAKQRSTLVEQRSGSMVVLQPRRELADLISRSTPARQPQSPRGEGLPGRADQPIGAGVHSAHANATIYLDNDSAALLGPARQSSVAWKFP